MGAEVELLADPFPALIPDLEAGVVSLVMRSPQCRASDDSSRRAGGDGNGRHQRRRPRHPHGADVRVHLTVITFGALSFGRRFGWYSIGTVIVILVTDGIVGIQTAGIPRGTRPREWD